MIFFCYIKTSNLIRISILLQFCKYLQFIFVFVWSIWEKALVRRFVKSIKTEIEKLWERL